MATGASSTSKPAVSHLSGLDERRAEKRSTLGRSLVTSENDCSLVVIVVDASIHTPEDAPLLEQLIEHTCVFANGIIMLHPGNKIVLVAAGRFSAQVLYPTTSIAQYLDERAEGRAVRHAAQTGLAAFCQSDLASARAAEHPSWWQLSSGLALALCLCSKTLRHAPALQPRLLALSRHRDTPHQYVPLMNAIFAAQRLAIPIDSCCIAAPASVFLQQAAHLTGGVHEAIAEPHCLAQVLVTSMLADAHARELLVLPTLDRVDYSATCFCHQREIAHGLVCSACLSVFCEFAPRCSTCGTRFDSTIGASRARSVADPSGDAAPMQLAEDEALYDGVAAGALAPPSEGVAGGAGGAGGADDTVVVGLAADMSQ